MEKKRESPIIVGASTNLGGETPRPPTLEESIELYTALYTDWTDADIVLENLGYLLENAEGILVPLSDRILEAIKDAKEGQR